MSIGWHPALCSSNCRNVGLKGKEIRNAPVLNPTFKRNQSHSELGRPTRMQWCTPAAQPDARWAQAPPQNKVPCPTRRCTLRAMFARDLKNSHFGKQGNYVTLLCFCIVKLTHVRGKYAYAKTNINKSGKAFTKSWVDLLQDTFSINNCYE